MFRLLSKLTKRLRHLGWFNNKREGFWSFYLSYLAGFANKDYVSSSSNDLREMKEK